MDLKVNIGEYDIQVVDSYKIKKRKDIKKYITELKAEYCSHPVFVNISEKTLISEWCVHNLLYKLNILKSRTKDVDFNSNKSKIEIVLYRLLSIFYIGL